MGRKCSVVGCHSLVGLHCFPQNLEMRCQWLRKIGLGENSELPLQAGVCKQHFAREAFANIMEFELGFAKKLMLKSDAVPALALPRLCERSPTLLPRKLLPLLPIKEDKGTVDVGCQTDRVLTMHQYVQANRRPPFRSTAIQARAPSRSVYCDTQDLTERPETSCIPERSSKRRREESDSDSSSSTSDESILSTNNEVSPHKVPQFIIDEDKLMALFVRCPICSSICDVSKATTRTLLCIKQHCGFCDTSNEWFSHG